MITLKKLAPIALVAVASALVFVAEGCGSSAAPPPPPPGGGAVAAKPKASASASASATVAPITFSESDFSESDTSRDPFHAFTQVVKPSNETKVVPQYQVVLEKYAIDELKLVALVGSGGERRAMFVDPTGKGWIVQRGAHIGKGEMVKLGPGAMSGYPLYWKIDRIKENEVVLVREDTLHPEVQPTYREVPLHVEGEKS